MSVGPEEECGVSLGVAWLPCGTGMALLLCHHLSRALLLFQGVSGSVRSRQREQLCPPACSSAVCFHSPWWFMAVPGPACAMQSCPQPGVQGWRLRAAHPALCPLLVSPGAQPRAGRAGCGMGMLRGCVKALGACRKQNILSERGQGESQVPRKRTLQGRRR